MELRHSTKGCLGSLIRQSDDLFEVLNRTDWYPYQGSIVSGQLVELHLVIRRIHSVLYRNSSEKHMLPEDNLSGAIVFPSLMSSIFTFDCIWVTLRYQVV